MESIKNEKYEKCLVCEYRNENKKLQEENKKLQQDINELKMKIEKRQGTKINLTERDKQLLETIARLGIISMEEVKPIYNNGKQYPQRRISKLTSFNYIRKNKQYIELGIRGEKYIRSIGKEIRTAPKTIPLKKRNKKITVLMNRLKASWEFIPSWEVKNQVDTNRGDRYYGMIISREKYMIYNIGEAPSDKYFKGLLIELKKLQMKGISRVIILAESKEAMNQYPREDKMLQEEILLPYTEEGIALLNAYGKENINKKAVKLAFPTSEIKKSSWVDADYDINGVQTFVLVLNDLAKKEQLKSYLEINKYKRTIEETPVMIICLEEQEKQVQEEFPGVKIESIGVDKLINI